MVDLVKYTTDEKTRNIYSSALKTAKEDLKNIPRKIDQMEETTNQYFEESPFSEMRSEKTWKHEFVELSKSITNEVIEDINWEEVYPFRFS